MNRRAQPWLGTLVEVSIGDALGEGALNACFRVAFDAIATVHRLMSFHDAASDVARVNIMEPGGTIEVDRQTHRVLRAALALALESDSAFDIGCAPLLVERNYLPQPQQCRVPAASANGFLRLSGETVVEKTAPGWIDLGGIAKGYAVDAAIEALAACSVQSACVNAGGDLRVLGQVPFVIGIRDPAGPAAIARTVALRDGALATSGTYFSRKTIGGTECSALIDARAGRCLTQSLSVSVRAPGCMMADALTKVVAATGDAGHRLLTRYAATGFTLV